jgi:hypothetical protein
MSIGPWIQALLSASPKQSVKRGDVLAVLIANAVLIGFNIALTDVLLTKVMTLNPPPIASATKVGCAVQEQYGAQSQLEADDLNRVDQSGRSLAFLTEKDG